MRDQGELFEIPSPCVNVCEWNNRGYCLGCFRSREERFNWLKISDFQRQRVINACARRKSKVKNNKLKKQLQSDQDTMQLEMFEPNIQLDACDSPMYIDPNLQPPLF